jgi:hypothetical protein
LPKLTIVEESDKELLSCIDKAFDSLGESVKQVVFWNFERMFHLKRSEIPAQPERFVEAIRSMFGPGANIIERNIIREISNSVELANTDGRGLAIVIAKARSQFRQSKNGES